MPKDVTWAVLPMRVSVSLNSQFPNYPALVVPFSRRSGRGVGDRGCGEACGSRPAEGPGHQPFLAPEFLISINIYFLPPLPGSQHRGASGRLDWACV